MKYMRQFLVILAVGFAGEVLNELIPLPVPSCIHGMVILFLLLYSKALKLEQVRDAGRFLVEIQPIMFVAPVVGLMTIWAEIKNSVLLYIIFGIISTAFIIGVSACVTQFVIRHQKGNRK